MSLHFEVFATGVASPDALWAVVGDPRRLPDWTDADRVEQIEAGPATEGARFVTGTGEQRLTWTVITTGTRLLEVSADTRVGTLGLGVRVVRDPIGSRLILAGKLQPSGSRWVARLVHVPMLTRRFDRWSAAALRVATAT